MKIKSFITASFLACAVAAPFSANAFWGGNWMPWDWFDDDDYYGPWGYPGYGYGGYPGYGYGGYPGYGYGGYPGYGYGGYPGYGYGGYPAYGYPGYNYGTAPAAPQQQPATSQ